MITAKRRLAAWRFLATACLTVLCLHASADQFVQVTNPGWTNSSQYSWTGAWGDYDKDGFIDLFVPNSLGFSGASTNFLYHNNGDGTFTRQFADQVGPIASDQKTSWGGYWGDVNNDGFLDLLAVGNAAQVYLNQGNGTFRSADAGDLSKVSGSNNGWITWADYDNDGNLDVFVCMSGNNQLFRGRGDGTFGRITNSVIATDRTSYCNDATWGDFNNDGNPDLIVANWSAHDFFYRNDGHGHFTRMTNSILEKYVSAHHAWGDYDNDGFLDLASGTTGSNTRLFRNNGSGDFVLATNLTAAAGGSSPVWGDYDNDGYLDLLLIQGQSAVTQLRLFHNNGDGTFTRVEDVFTRPSANWMGGGWGDYDNDGFLDLFVAQTSGKNALYHNLGNTNHWIKFQLEGTAANRTAIGAKVRVKATIGGKTIWQMREVSGGNYCQNDLRPNFGLGDATNVDLVRIEWPSGNVQELTDVTPNQLLTVKESVGITPTNPSSSLNGSVTLTRTPAVIGTYQWQFNGVDLADQTNRTLNLTNIQASQEGRYSVIATTGEQPATNFVYLHVDTLFTKITTGPGADRDNSLNCYWADYNKDGFIDLFVANGYLGIRTCFLYQNNGDGTFTQVITGSLVNDKGNWDGAAWGDYDNNGFLDMFVVDSKAGGNALYRNNGNGNHWVIFKLAGTASNRSAIGAKVRVKATTGGKTFWQMRQITGSFYDDLRAHFGLGNATKADVVRIEWPSGAVQEFADVAADQILTVTEPSRLQPLGVGQFQIGSWQGMSYEVQASTNLTDWTPLGTVTNRNGTLNCIDPNAVSYPQRFYRAVAK